MEERLSGLISGLHATISTAKEIQKVYDKDLATGFNSILAFWSIGENKLSRILAFFLDPVETHGQGTLFLKAFLEKAFPDRNISVRKVNVHCEFPTHENRRIDVCLNFNNGELVIGIENKIWAKDQPRQLADYSNFLEKQYGNYCLLYLTSYNKEPDEISITKKELDVLRKAKKIYFFDHSTGISNLIKEWIHICHSEKVRFFLKDLYQYIQYEINGETFMGQSDLISNYVLANNERLETALALCNTRQSIYNSLLTKFKMQLEELAVSKEIILTEFTIWEPKPYIGFSFSIMGDTGNELWLRYEFDERNYKGFFFGVLSNGKKQEWLEELLIRNLGKMDLKGPTDSWPWWNWYKEKNWTDETFLKVNNGLLAKEIGEQLETLIPQIKEVLKDDRGLFWSKGKQ